jgi:DNA-binding NarL/FixJ family response regulator
LSPYQIVLADDHVMFRRGVKKMLQGMNDVEVVGEAGDGLELLEILKKTAPHLVILDISMPKLRGLEAVREVKTIHPQTKVLMLTMHKDKEYLYHALSAGAEGYLLKEDADTELFRAIETLRQGGTYVSPLLSPQLTDLFKEKSHYATVALHPPGEMLTAREKMIIKLIAEGKSSREIAALLYISNRTVQHHRANIIRKLNLRRTADLVKYAIQKGYITSEGA